MLFKSTTGDLSNTEDCFLCSLNKNLWQKPKKIVYSSIAQSVERMTVNHDVTGSSPVGGAKRKRVAKATRFSFVFNISAQPGSKSPYRKRSGGTHYIKKVSRWALMS